VKTKEKHSRYGEQEHGGSGELVAKTSISLRNASLGTVQKSDQKIKKNANDADKGQVVSENWSLVWIFGSLVTPSRTS
jgi:hypothetical protein